jgi:thiol-disulfide isomerase/thioredoxin
MSMPEKLPQENPQENPPHATAWCPECGSAVSPEAKLNLAPDAQTCPSCGMPRGPQLVAPGSESAAGFPVQAAAAPPKRRNPMALVVVAVVVALMLYAGFHFARSAESSTPPSVLGATTPAPDFMLESLDGKNVRLSDLRGKAVLLNFWATWCGPCKIETPWLVQLQNQYGSQGLQVVGVAMDDSGKDEIAKFAKEMGMNYPVLLGKEAVGDAYGGIPYLPESFFIGRDGKIVSKIMGIDSRSVLESAVKKALDTRSSAANAVEPALEAHK